MESAQKDRPENGDDGGCEPGMVSSVFTAPGLHSIQNFCTEQITR